MTNALKFNLETASSVPDPSTESGLISFFNEALGQDGRPFIIRVEDPPNKTRERHYHHGDVLYVYTEGEHHIEGEDTYSAGDLRWTRAGHAYGPETTGPDGGAWWIISYSDPTPVAVPTDAKTGDQLSPVDNVNPTLPSFSRPYDWEAIDRETQLSGGVILKELIPEKQLADLDSEIDTYLEANVGQGDPDSGSDRYNLFLGHNTIRLHGLIEKFASSQQLIGHEEIVSWANRMLSAKASSILLNAGELIQINPGEPHQAAHRDTDSWPVSIEADPVIVNAIVALDEFTIENGATAVAPGSWDWETGRRPTSQEYARAIMQRGDALLFRADLIHGGGENKSANRRRAISISYCAGWLRPVENSYLNVSKDTADGLPQSLQALLGYQAHDGADRSAGMVGLYENGDPQMYFNRVGEN